jgi:hypothetical protein
MFYHEGHEAHEGHNDRIPFFNSFLPFVFFVVNKLYQTK